MPPLPHLPNEIIFMILLQLVMAAKPRIFHLKRRNNITTGVNEIAFYDSMQITQPIATRLARFCRDWANEYYALAFTSTANNGQPIGGVWIHRSIDLVYIDNAFCGSSLNSIRHISMANVTKIAVDATLLNNATGRLGFKSLMDELLTCFSNAKNMVFMVPTRPNPPFNRYPGLRLVDEQEDEPQKDLRFTNFYHCGQIAPSRTGTTILFSHMPHSQSVTVIRAHLHRDDKLKLALDGQNDFEVILFQRQGMRAPTRSFVTGPNSVTNKALNKICSRMHALPISPESELLQLVERSEIAQDLD